MKISPKSLTNLVIGTVAGISLVSLLMPQLSLAQTTDVNPLQDFNSEQNQDPFSNISEGNSFSMFDIIHRANLGSISIDDYSAGQNESLNNAAAEFRKKQLQRMQQQQATPINQVTAPQVAN